MITKEQVLLSKLYECQELMEDTLGKGVNDVHYQMITVLIKRLEGFLQNQQDIL